MKPFVVLLLLSITSTHQQAGIAPMLTAVYEDGRQLVKLKWQHSNKRIVSYCLQSSRDNFTWSPIHEIKIADPSKDMFITYTDTKVSAGKNYYRLKAVMTDRSIAYSSSQVILIGPPGKNWLIYPVPVRDILNLQYNGNELIRGVITVVIRHSNGRIFHTGRYASSTRYMQIPVDNLGSGIYDIRIVINDEVVWNQRFVK